MKKRLVLAAMFSVVLTLGMAVMSCGDKDSGDITSPGGTDPGNTDPGNTDPATGGGISFGETIGPLSVQALSASLAGLPANTATSSHIVKLDSSVIIDTGDPSSDGVWATINSTVQNAGKYVFLDLSECSAVGNKIEGSSYQFTGCKMNIIKDNQYIKGIVLPDSLISIGGYAFYHCSSLTYMSMSVELTKSLYRDYSKSMGLHVVLTYTGNIAVELTGTGSIAKDAFEGCIELTSVTIGAGVTGVGEDTFDGCTNLTAVIVDEANNDYSSIDGVLFNKDKTSLLFYPEGRTGSYTIPSGVTNIAYGAFEGCSKLTGVIIPEGVTSIEESAFYKCTALASVIIPENITSIGAYSWSWSYPNLNSISILRGAFHDCSALTSVTIPAWATAGFAAKFSGYSNLAVVLTGTGSIPNSAFTSFRSTSGYQSDCKGITSVTIGDGVTGIGQAAFFGCTGLTSISIGAGVTSIGTGAFSECTGLTSITIPNGVNRIRSRTFYNCTNLTNVTIPNSEDISPFWDFVINTSIDLVPPDSPGVFPDSQIDALAGDILQRALSKYGQETYELAKEGLGGGVSTIESSAFSGCTKLETVTFTGSSIYDHQQYINKNIVGVFWDFLILSLDSLLATGNPVHFLNVIDRFNKICNGIAGKDTNRGFYDSAFPEGSSGEGGNALKKAYLADGTGGTYTRDPGGSTWAKQ
ncbi:hypothetical protein FACS189450_01660 [Spirochaetia bacterium]|nr:hypothetical protein FACS189450_01660 [Spirochaetia bacterium]